MRFQFRIPGTTPLVIGAAERTTLASLRAKALADPSELSVILAQIKTKEGLVVHMARMRDFTVKLPYGFLVTFSIETGWSFGTARHMSMSSRRRGAVPNVPAIELVMKELGFIGGVKACASWKEDIGYGQFAINIVQPYGELNEQGESDSVDRSAQEETEPCLRAPYLDTATSRHYKNL